MKAWQVLGREYLLERPWLNVRVDRVRTDRGVEIDEYHVLECRSWVAIVALTGAGEIVLAQQYRHGVEAVTLELPAGALDDGEEPLSCAQRELREETGYASDDWIALGAVSPETSRHDHRAHLFVARGATRVAETQFDATENIRVVCATPAELARRIDSGEFPHGIHLAAVLLAVRKGLLELP